MADIVIAHEDKRSFLEKVIGFGIDHDILGREQRQRLAAESVGMYSAVCRDLGLNEQDIGQALQAGGIVKTLTGIALERESQSNELLASHILGQRSVADLVIPVLQSVEDGYRRVETVYHSGLERCYTAKFDYLLCLWFVNERQALFGLDQYFDVTASPSSFVLRTLGSFRTARDFEQWLGELTEMEAELELGKRFLPWSQLREEAKLQPAASIKTVSSIRDFTVSPSHLSDVIWSPDTLLATMTVTLVCGGTNRFVGTIFPAGMLDILKKNMSRPDYFRRRGREKFREYIEREEAWANDRRRKTPLLTAADKERLWRLWERAMDHLCQVPQGSSIRHFNMRTWFDRLHLDVNSKSFGSFAAMSEKQSARQRGKKQKSLLDKIRDAYTDFDSYQAFSHTLSPRRLAFLLCRARWSYVSLEDFREIMRLVPGHVLARHMPLDIDYIRCLVQAWEAKKKPDKTSEACWSADARHQLALRLIKESDRDFWWNCPEELLEPFMAVHQSVRKAIQEAIRSKLGE